MKSQIDLIE